MAQSRRGRIIGMLDAKKSDAQILRVLDIEFLPGTLKTTNKQALDGTKRSIGYSVSPSIKPESFSRRLNPQRPTILTSELTASELIQNLRAFQPELVIQRYKQKDLMGRSPDQLVAFTMGTSIARAFRYESPSQRYQHWRWYNNGDILLSKINAVDSQESFDQLTISLSESLVEDWGKTNERGEPSRMNIGVAMKIINLLLKHLAFSSYRHNDAVISLLHVPWDKFTLQPLANIWQGDQTIDHTASQGFVKTLDVYLQLHFLISDITRDAGVPRIIYEFWAWDAAHP